jgi:predicted dehydrogenase
MAKIDRRTWLQGASASALLAALSPDLQAQDAPAGRARPRIKIGQMGVGHAHATKLSVFRASPDYEVVGIVEPDAALREKARSQPAFRNLRWMSRDELLDVAGLDAVLVETRVRDLLDVAEACIAAGKHVHLDKPAGTSLPQYRRLLDAAAAKKRLVQMGYMYRYSPAVVLLRRMLAQGWLGEPFEVHAVMSKVIAPAERRGLAEYPGGTMFELGCHLIDLVVGLLGKPTAVTPFVQHAAAANDGLADNMLAVLRYPGALASVKSSALEVDGGERRHLVVCGTEGTFHIQPLDNPVARVTLSRPHDRYQQGHQEISFPKFTRYVADAADMARVIRGEKPSEFSYTHDYDVQETVLRASLQATDGVLGSSPCEADF